MSSGNLKISPKYSNSKWRNFKLWIIFIFTVGYLIKETNKNIFASFYNHSSSSNFYFFTFSLVVYFLFLKSREGKCILYLYPCFIIKISKKDSFRVWYMDLDQWDRTTILIKYLVSMVEWCDAIVSSEVWLKLKSDLCNSYLTGQVFLLRNVNYLNWIRQHYIHIRTFIIANKYRNSPSASRKRYTDIQTYMYVYIEFKKNNTRSHLSPNY